MSELDQVDADLFEALQTDGRASFETLGQRIGLTRIGARNRVQHLQDAGVIQIITAVHPLAIGLRIFGHLTVQVTGPATPVANNLAQNPHLPFVAVVTGQFAVIAEVRTRNLTLLREVVETVLDTPGVEHVSTCLYTQRILDRHSAQRIASPSESLHLDAVDVHIIEALQQNGRATFVDLAQRTSLSTTAVRTRVRRLIDSGAIHVGAVPGPGISSELGHVCGFGIRSPNIHQLADDLAQIPQVHYLTHCLGNWNLMGTLMCQSPAETATFLDRIRETATQVESWSHLHLIKEDYAIPASSSPSSHQVVKRPGLDEMVRLGHSWLDGAIVR